MKKIMFNDCYGLTQAVIEGRKTMTRRIITKTMAFTRLYPENWSKEDIKAWNASFSLCVNGMNEEERRRCLDYVRDNGSRYKQGEIVAVAQNYSSFYNILDNTRPIPEGAGWDNKMFVRADLMPHRIRITGIKCERLQDIQDADCLKEGVRYIPKINKFYFEDVHREAGFYFDDHREAFTMLIDKVSGRGTWASNPWVVVYEFELVK